MARRPVFESFCKVGFLLWLLAGCARSPVSFVQTEGKSVEIRHAKGFSIVEYPEYTVVSVRDPWDTARFLHRYVLVDRGKALPGHLPEGTVVRIPVQSTACLSGVDAGFLGRLGVAGTVTAIAEEQYIRVPAIVERVAGGRAVSVGEATAVNVERLLMVSPEIVITTPFQNTGYGALGKTDFPLVECASYMEASPLGRAEWLKFLAVFYGKQDIATVVFDSIETRYRGWATLARQAVRRPAVLSERKYGAVWHVPGGKSYMAAFFRDAGVDYFWQDTAETGSIPLSFEQVYARAAEADFWLLKSFDEDRSFSYAALRADFDLYSRFKAFRKQNVWYSNTAVTAYYERGTLEPDVILSELIAIFHPELLPGMSHKYFEPLRP